MHKRKNLLYSEWKGPKFLFKPYAYLSFFSVILFIYLSYSYVNYCPVIFNSFDKWEVRATSYETAQSGKQINLYFHHSNVLHLKSRTFCVVVYLYIYISVYSHEFWHFIFIDISYLYCSGYSHEWECLVFKMFILNWLTYSVVEYIIWQAQCRCLNWQFTVTWRPPYCPPSSSRDPEQEQL